jgi:hypothetical protein
MCSINGNPNFWNMAMLNLLEQIQFYRYRLVASVFLLFLFISNNSSAAGDYVFPSPGLDANGNWVNVDLVTWKKIGNTVYNYENTIELCAKANENIASGSARWQVPTSKQAQSVYEHTDLSTRSKWIEKLGPIWTSTPGLKLDSNQFVDLQSGIVNWDGENIKEKSVNSPTHPPKFAACVQQPEEFDKAGNYFDGQLVWSKITSKPETRMDADALCFKLDNPRRDRLKIKWTVATYKQLTRLSDSLKANKKLRDKLEQNGWVLGQTGVSDGSFPIMLIEGGKTPPGISSLPLKWDAFKEPAYVSCVYEPKLP